MKRYFILFSLLLIISTSQSFAFFTELFELGKFVINQAGVWADNITEEVFRKTMVLQTIESVNTLKKNYEETMKFYKEIQQLQENLYGITEEAKHKFLERLNYSVDKLQKEMDLKIKELENESKQIVNTKIVDYIKSNWDLGNKIVQTVEDRRKELKRKNRKTC
jgi:dsDNA-specific endonuclease/ATPase MutS2